MTKHIGKQLHSRLVEFTKNYFSKHLSMPSIKTIQKYSEKELFKTVSVEDAKLIKNSLETHSKYYKLNDKNMLYAKIQTSTLGWVQTDLFFVTFRGNKYGSGMIFVDILSKKVFVTSISSKKLSAVKKAIEKAVKFMPIRRLYSDKESSLRSLELNNKDFPNIKFFTTVRKAVIAERFIYTFKRWMAQYLTNQNIKITQWKNHIDKIQTKMNNRIIAKGDILGQRLSNVTPNRLNNKNIGLYVSHLLINKPSYYQSLYKIYSPQDPKLFFKYNINDIVYISKKIDPTMDRYKYSHDSKSFFGHFEKVKHSAKHDNSYKIIARRLLVSKNSTWLTVYDIKRTNSSLTLHNIYERYIRPFPSG